MSLSGQKQMQSVLTFEVKLEMVSEMKREMKKCNKLKRMTCHMDNAVVSFGVTDLSEIRTPFGPGAPGKARLYYCRS